MKITGNTILITGGGSGIGRGLAEALHAERNTVIIAGRRRQVLDETTAANPGMKSATLNIEDAASIRSFAAQLAKDYPALNVVIHNAGIMRMEKLLAPQEDLADAEAIITTNLLGPIRLNAALLPHLIKQSHAAILTVSSGLAFTPLAGSPTYCATKAAIHSYTESMRYQLSRTKIEVIEIVPPYVQTELGGSAQANDPRAMPLKDFISETIALLKTEPAPKEILVERVKPLRYAECNGNYDAIFNQLATMNETH